jgi:hypothetical protein
MPKIFTFMFEGGEGTIGFLIGIFYAYTVIPIFLYLFYYIILFFTKKETIDTLDGSRISKKAINRVVPYNSTQRQGLWQVGRLKTICRVYY